MISATARAEAIKAGYHSSGNTAHDAAGGLLVVNRAYPQVTDANTLLHPVVESTSGVGRLLAVVRRELAHASRPQIQIGARSAAPLEARLAVDDWTVELIVDLLLDAEPVGAPPKADIRMVSRAADWQALRRLWRADHVEEAERRGQPAWPPAVTDAVVASKRSKQPALRIWLARHGGVDSAFVTSWSGVDGGGMVEDLFTAPDHRGRGLARALLHHAIADVRRRASNGGATGPVLIGARIDETSKQLYERLGFHPVMVRRIWTAPNEVSRN